VIVVDASVVVEVLIGGPAAPQIMNRLADSGDLFIVPHLLDVEVVSALRGLCAGKRVDPARVKQYLDDLSSFPAERFHHAPLLSRVWDLRGSFNAYDAVYIALAEETGAVLYTCDAKLTRGHRAPVVSFPL
jgi:predicted nucleic acid-binding protein